MSEGLIVIIGSGELGPSMKATYRHLFEHVAASSVTILDSPYGFQENADELTARIEKHFRDGFGVKTNIASLRRGDAKGEEQRRFLESVEQSEVVFAGPGSPSYALRVWSGLGMREALAAVVDRGGGVVMASAAAVTLGARSIPVYEIYKVGDDPVWLDGLDVLASYGLSVVVVPHWNNHEGGFHDTSHCFIGIKRFRQLVADLPPEISVLSIDEHTSFSIHAVTGMMRVLGAGEAHFNDKDFDSSLPNPGIVSRPALPKPESPAPATNPWQPVVELLLEIRDEARGRGDFAQADLIRRRLATVQIEIRDGADGTEWREA